MLVLLDVPYEEAVSRQERVPIFLLTVLYDEIFLVILPYRDAEAFTIIHIRNHHYLAGLFGVEFRQTAPSERISLESRKWSRTVLVVIV